jgi:hypothetical protein
MVGGGGGGGGAAYRLIQQPQAEVAAAEVVGVIQEKLIACINY